VGARRGLISRITLISQYNMHSIFTTFFRGSAGHLSVYPAARKDIQTCDNSGSAVGCRRIEHILWRAVGSSTGDIASDGWGSRLHAWNVGAGPVW
jgi:hypothetical protein